MRFRKHTYEMDEAERKARGKTRHNSSAIASILAIPFGIIGGLLTDIHRANASAPLPRDYGPVPIVQPNTQETPYQEPEIIDIPSPEIQAQIHERETQNLESKLSQSQTDYKISQSGIEIIKESEGFKPEIYLDVAGHPTIGYGHLIRPNENYQTITKREAESLLRQDLEISENAVRDYVAVPLNQNQYDALVSLTFNIGNYAFQESTLLKVLNSGDYAGASKEFDRWNKITKNGKKVPVKGLINRRNAEEELFLSN